MVAIRQEINILNREFVNPTGDADLGGAIVDYDPAKYSGETVYLEVVAKNTDGSNVLYVNLHDSSDNEHESLTVPINTSSYTLIRSAIDTTLTDDKYHIYLEDNTATWAAKGSLKSARLVILQSAADITDTQTQIEVGAYCVQVPADANTWAAIAEPKYWKYESAKWDPTPTFILAFTAVCEDDKESYHVALQEDDGSFNWQATYKGEVSDFDSETVTYYESASFTPTNDRHYRLVYQGDDTKDDLTIFNAKVIATQTHGTAITKLQPEYLIINDSSTTLGNQEFMTEWKTTEWDGVTNIYYHEHSASNSTSLSKLEYDDGGSWTLVTNSTTLGDDLIRSAAVTMPSSDDEIDTDIVVA